VLLDNVMRVRSAPEVEARAAALAEQLRRAQGVREIFQSKTHELHPPLTWVGANTGR
jgi:hypothetical protein